MKKKPEQVWNVTLKIRYTLVSIIQSKNKLHNDFKLLLAILATE